MTEWKTGDVITAERLNGMQKEPLIITETVADYVGTLDKTWKEIHDAFYSGRPCIFSLDDGHDYNGLYSISLVYQGGSEQFTVNDVYNHSWSATTENGYPEYYYGD